MPNRLEPQPALQAIVCVDDDAPVLGALREQLRRGLGSHCEVETARSGAEALTLLDELAQDGYEVPLLISDQHMPGMGGVDLLAQVHAQHPAMLKIMLSGNADAQVLGDAVNRAGLYRVLLKPWNADDLLMTVREALRSAAQRRALAATHLELQRSMAQLRHQALHDALTGLPNRQQFDEVLAQALDRAREEGHELAVLFVDLDRFKRVNDTLGHAAGDQLLRIVVERLRRCVREGDLIARWGGDEFTVLLPRVQGSAEARVVAERLLAALAPPLDLDGCRLHVSASIGVTLFPEHGLDAETLLKNADSALYRVKAEGRNGFREHHAAGLGEPSLRLQLESALHRALSLDELRLHYQPQIDTRTGCITHVEALARWRHRTLGWVPPQTFIPLAEETGLILPIGRWVLNEACRQAMDWSRQGLPDVTVAVNVSGVQFERGAVQQDVDDALAASGLPAARLEIEITEAVGLQSTSAVADVLRALQARGVQVALDDFGTGFAPLSHVKELPCQVLKIDRSFVRQLKAGSKDAAIVAAVVALGRGLQLRTVAEGVETEEAEALLRSLGCTSLQGFRLDRPLEPDALAERLRLQLRTQALTRGVIDS
jgi:diguanylate cyclase (GGDEF)-like protein